MSTLYYKIEGMNCEACEKIIDLEVKEIPGIKKSTIDSQKGEGIFEVDEGVDPNLIVEKISTAGYKSNLIKEE